VDKKHQPETTNDSVKGLGGHLKVFCSSSQRCDIGQTSGASVIPHMVQHRIGNIARDDVPFCANPMGSEQRLASCPTGNVEHAGTGIDTCHAKHRYSGRLHPRCNGGLPACPTGGCTFPLCANICCLLRHNPALVMQTISAA